MNSLQTMFEQSPAQWTLVPYLIGAMWVVSAWFPGHNARQWAHGHAKTVSTLGGMWGLAGISLTFFRYAMPAMPVMILLWVAIVTWSYGRSELTARAKAARGGFEVVYKSDDDEDFDGIPIAEAC